MITNMTHIGAFSRMPPDMNSQRTTLIETLPAVFTRIRLLTTMHPFVHHQIILLGETFRAIRTRVRFHPRVHPVVHAQLLLRSKALAANVAQMALFAHRFTLVLVHDVFLQSATFGENTQANVALIR